MSWSYSLTPPMSNRNIIRTLIFDTDTSDQLLQDEQIDTLIVIEVGDPNAPINVHRVAAEAARTIAASFSRQGDQQDGTVRVQFNQRAADYRVRGAELFERGRRSGGIPYAGGISIGDKMTVAANEDRVRPMFNRDMLTSPGTATGAEQGVGSGKVVVVGGP